MASITNYTNEIMQQPLVAPTQQVSPGIFNNQDDYNVSLRNKPYGNAEQYSQTNSTWSRNVYEKTFSMWYTPSGIFCIGRFSNNQWGNALITSSTTWYVARVTQQNKGNFDLWVSGQYFGQCVGTRASFTTISYNNWFTSSHFPFWSYVANLTNTGWGLTWYNVDGAPVDWVNFSSTTMSVQSTSAFVAYNVWFACSSFSLNSSDISWFIRPKTWWDKYVSLELILDAWRSFDWILTFI